MTKVTLRKKAISKARHSLYLDFYPPIPNLETGKPTRREFLQLYLYDKPNGEIQKTHNKETEKLAEYIQASRQLKLQAQDYGFLIKETQNSCFIEYFRKQVTKRKGSNSGNWKSALPYLEKFSGGTIKMVEVNEGWCNDFKEYLLNACSRRSKDKPLSQNSVVSYFNKLKAALAQAYKDGLLINDINSKIDSVKPQETQRLTLTIEELKKLTATDCSQPILKRAALFSALTGLRFSDIEKLTWGEVEETASAEGIKYYLNYTQKKTKSVQVHPISEQAYKLLGEPNDSSDLVFQGLKYSAYQNVHLRQWIMDAGIHKKITFHNFRHTFATLQVHFGTHIVTIKDLLGHKNLKTTMVYAKSDNLAKMIAANKIQF